MAVAHDYTRSAYHSPHKQNHSWRAAASWLSPAGHFTRSVGDAARHRFGDGQGNPRGGAARQEQILLGLGLAYVPPVLTDVARK